MTKIADIDLMTQTDARQLAKARNAEDPSDILVWIAVPYPFNSWGGAEKGWLTVLVSTEKMGSR